MIMIQSYLIRKHKVILLLAQLLKPIKDHAMHKHLDTIPA